MNLPPAAPDQPTLAQGHPLLKQQTNVKRTGHGLPLATTGPFSRNRSRSEPQSPNSLRLGIGRNINRYGSDTVEFRILL